MSADPDRGMVGRWIKGQRERRRWSQRELAERVGVTLRTIGNWETGATHPGIRVLGSLEDLFGVLLDALPARPMPVDPPRPPPTPWDQTTTRAMAALVAAGVPANQRTVLVNELRWLRSVPYRNGGAR